MATYNPASEPAVSPALDALRTQQESNMLFASYAANATGLLTGVHTHWDVGEGPSENTCGKLTGKYQIAKPESKTVANEKQEKP